MQKTKSLSSYSIYGIHPIIEAITSGKTIEKLFIQKDLKGDNFQTLKKLLLEHKDIPVQKVPKEKLSRLTRKNHQGIFAFISPITYYKVEDLIPCLYEEGKTPLLLILDQIHDVGNFGAIIRSALAMGVDGIIIPSKGSALINDSVIKSSSGAIFKIPICKEVNLYRAMRYLKDSGISIIGSFLKGDQKRPDQLTYHLPMALLIGNEEKGVSKDLLSLCDESLKIPISNKIDSLNASVATGILLYEVYKQRILIKAESIKKSKK